MDRVRWNTYSHEEFRSVLLWLISNCRKPLSRNIQSGGDFSPWKRAAKCPAGIAREERREGAGLKSLPRGHGASTTLPNADVVSPAEAYLMVVSVPECPHGFHGCWHWKPAGVCCWSCRRGGKKLGPTPPPLLQPQDSLNFNRLGILKAGGASSKVVSPV